MNKKYIVIGVAVVILAALGVFGYLNYGTRVAVPQKVYHVGVLNALDFFGGTTDAFKEKMTELGYVEGKNITYDVVKGPQPVGNQAILKRFVDNHVDLILAFPTEASLEAKEITKGTGIPIVSTEAAMEGTDLIQSIGHPGGNLTGVRFPIPEVTAKRFEILHEIVPKAKRILIPYLKDYPTVAPSLLAIQSRAKDLGVTLVEAPFAAPPEVDAFLAARASGDPGFDAILMIPEPVSIVPPFSDPIYEFADARKIPVAGVVILKADHGPLFSLIPQSEEFGRLAAPLADKIFRGVDPGTIPIATPESRLEINYRAIQKLGLTVSESLLATADEIFR